MHNGKAHDHSQPSDKAAQRGEPSYVWRAGQERRLALMSAHGGEAIRGKVLVDGCGVGEYLKRINQESGQAIGLDIEFERALEAAGKGAAALCAAGEALPFAAGSFEALLSHEVIEHVQDDRQAAREIARVLKPGGVLLMFAPNRGYPFETHGVMWRGKYRFGNIPLVNYLPRRWRDKLAPHVRVYSGRDLGALFAELPMRVTFKTVLFGAYDNLIARFGKTGKFLRAVLQGLEKTPLKALGLSHFWVLRKDA